MSKTPFAQIQLPLSETNGTAAVEFYPKCQLVAQSGQSLRRNSLSAFGQERTLIGSDPEGDHAPELLLGLQVVDLDSLIVLPHLEPEDTGHFALSTLGGRL